MGNNKKKIVLILSASPKDLSDPEANPEIRTIREQFNKHKYGSDYKLEISSGVTPSVIISELTSLNPHIVHFIGHANSSGIIIEKNQKTYELSNTDLAFIFKNIEKNISCVIFNACNSNAQAKSIEKFIPISIGTNGDLFTDIAIEYSKNFYSILLSRSSHTLDALSVAHNIACLGSDSRELYTIHKSYAEAKESKKIENKRKNGLRLWGRLNENHPMNKIYCYSYTDEKRFLATLRITKDRKTVAFISDEHYLKFLIEKLKGEPVEEDLRRFLDSLSFLYKISLA